VPDEGLFIGVGYRGENRVLPTVTGAHGAPLLGELLPAACHAAGSRATLVFMETSTSNHQMSHQPAPTRPGWVRDARIFYRGFAIAAIFWGLVFVAFTHR
jgi:hypothetical protein